MGELPRLPRPPRLVALGAVSAPVRWLGLHTAWLEPEALLERVRRTTGLDDFGTPHPREALTVLVRALHDEADLTGLGAVVAREQLTLLLSSRLRGVDEQKRFAERLDAPVRAPIFIVGLHRTGTTLLQQLLATHPALRPLPAWLAITPSPPPTRQEWDSQSSARIAQSAKALGQWAWMSPDWAAKHDVGALQPEEEAPILFEGFRSWTPIGNYPVPTYMRWALEQDQAPTYAWLKARLQVFQAELPGERWLLKSPYHLQSLATLKRAFPDAKLVYTHRDPARCVPSLVDMLEQAWQVVSRTPRRPELAEAVLELCARGVEHARQAREEFEDDVLDVPMKDLLADPVATAERICDFAELPVPAGYADALRGVLGATEKRTTPKAYGVEDYGWTEEGVRARVG